MFTERTSVGLDVRRHPLLEEHLPHPGLATRRRRVRGRLCRPGPRPAARSRVAAYLWERKQVVPFLKVDLGMAEKIDGVQLMKPIDTLGSLLERAKQHGVFGTKMRSVIADADRAGVEAIADQHSTTPRASPPSAWCPSSSRK